MNQRILIVDDEAPIRQLIRQHLEAAKYTVFEADNGLVASEWFKENRADLTILDVVMPEMDGIEFAYELKRRFPEMPVVAMSAGEHIMSKELCLGMMECLGANEVFTKPFKVEKLLDAVNGLLHKSARDN